MSDSRKKREMVRYLKETYRSAVATEEFKQKCLSEIIMEARRLSPRNAFASNIQKIAVVVHVDSDILHGFITVPANMRLSDYLNTNIKFIKITDVSLSHPGGQEITVPEININKDTIKMIRTVERDAARGSKVRGNRRLVKKIPVRAAIHMADYELNGFLYSVDAGRVDRLLESRPVFLPCTEVDIRNIRNDEVCRTGFAAINRKRVNLIQVTSVN